MEGVVEFMLASDDCMMSGKLILASSMAKSNNRPPEIGVFASTSTLCLLKSDLLCEGVSEGGWMVGYYLVKTYKLPEDLYSGLKGNKKGHVLQNLQPGRNGL